ncbi:ribokinase [Streptococcus iniae]|uniref:Ribokinase n=1 Tax=Streptococcus iniae TaxID=1346 RepID=A0A3L8GNB8_STRIN|nr:ribokinase [Streptococcus iniae]AGM98326.1 ribokinase [Streptococcus iniae SF1]AHY15376.1 ribokinase [Streptococcus iniae]AHY17245.1 ribokinase [Streptococcus iniae]AJG25551.1 ribokinase [Streptococcus iniae]APD31421.1 ribokinase [Streptococcus iniae]
MSNIVVVGSISMDLVMETSRIALEGETVFGDAFSMVPGGKGANQAVALGRLSHGDDCVSMIGTVGNDSFGPILVDNLKKNAVNVDCVGTVPESSGIAQITLFNQDNRIIVFPGANALVDTGGWTKEWEIIKTCDLVILQNEIPHEVNLQIASYCHDHKIRVLYNPAPARSSDLEMIDYVTYFTPNEGECKELFPDKTIEEALKSFPNKLIVTLGSKGSTYYDGKQIQMIPAIKTQAVDTTGAGDTFNGAFGFALSNDLAIADALRFATLASHLSVQKFGAQGGMPTLDEMKGHEAYEEKWNLK